MLGAPYHVRLVAYRIILKLLGFGLISTMLLQASYSVVYTAIQRTDFVSTTGIVNSYQSPCVIDATFTVNGRTHKVDYNTCDYRKGQSLAVKYNPSNPDDNFVESEETGGIVGAIVISGVMLGLGLIFLQLDRTVGLRTDRREKPGALK